MRRNRRAGSVFGLALLAAGLSHGARADVSEVRISNGYGMSYLPLVIMRQQKLLETEAANLGVPNLKVTWLLIDGGRQVNDAMLGGAVDIAATGVPGFATWWAKAKGSSAAVTGLASVSSFAVYLNSRDPKVKTIDDFTSSDRIGLPSIKTSLAAGILQMAAADKYGMQNYAKLDPLTVGIPQPDGMAALLSGTGITAHFTTPPFSYMELENPQIHRVLNSVDVIGHTSLALTFSTQRFVAANPKLIQAFDAALNDADNYIHGHNQDAANIFVQTSDIKVPPEIAQKIMADPDTIYTPVLNGIQKYVDFMFSAGLLKEKVANWKTLFAPSPFVDAGN